MEAGDKQAVAAQLRSHGPDRRRHRGAGPAERRRPPRALQEGQGGRPRHRHAPALDDGELRACRCCASLYVIEEQTENDKLREILIDGPQGRGGRPLALRRAAQAPGHLQRPLRRDGRRPARRAESWTSTLLRVADQLEKDAALRRQIKAAMIYPSLIGGFAFVVLFALVAFLVPVFEKIFKDFGGELPADHEVHGVCCRTCSRGAGTCCSAAIVRRSSGCSGSGRTPSAGAMQWDRLKLKFPMKIGDIVQKVALARFSRTFSGLIAAGVPMLEAIDITGKTSGNKVIEKAMDDVRESVKKGGSLTAPMTRGARGLPGHGHPDDRRGRGDRCPRDDDVARSPTSTRSRSRPPSRRSPRSSSRS